MTAAQLHDPAGGSLAGEGGGVACLRPSLPIVRHLVVSLDEGERRRLDGIATKLLQDEPLLNSTQAFGPRVSAGLGPWPALVLEDHSTIRLFEDIGDRIYSYRALFLAGDGDLVVIGVPRSEGFERYCREDLNLGRVRILTPRDGARGKSITLRCLVDPDLIERAADLARHSGGLNLTPYMGTGGTWLLAGRIAAEAGCEVRVTAPPPRLTRRANDKLWFAERVKELFGRAALPPSHPVFGLAALAARVADLARRHETVAIKLPDSASSEGNMVLDAKRTTGVSLSALRAYLEELLRRDGWLGRFPVLVTAWEQPLLASPSAQLWIPPRNQGAVVVEGVFDQSVKGVARVFSGAAPTALSESWQSRIALESARMGYLFQCLGYVGRCSFDAIVVGEDEAGAELHWVECNGRWGGTSIPMTLANRLVGDWQQKPFVVIERDDLSGPGRPVEAFLDEYSEDLFQPGTRPHGAVLLSPGQVERGSGFEIMVLGDTLEEARSHADRLYARLSERSIATA